MNQKQKAKWERTRSKGRWHFVLLYGVLVFAGLMIITTSVYSMLIGTFAYNNLKLTVPAVLIGGFVFGLALWLVGEYMYRQSSSNANSNEVHHN
jgi:uncharacterized membrane protein YedE/YeeE